GERFSFEGRHYTVTDSPALPNPVQRRHPRIIAGGAGAKRTPELAARFADEFNVPFHRVEDFTKAVKRVRQACEAVGRDPDSLTYSAAVNVDVKAETTSQVVEKLGAFKDAGAERAYLQLLDLGDTDQVRL